MTVAYCLLLFSLPSNHCDAELGDATDTQVDSNLVWFNKTVAEERDNSLKEVYYKRLKKLVRGCYFISLSTII